ncbi:putative Zinc finger protein 280D, partial [Daphnia magna]
KVAPASQAVLVTPPIQLSGNAKKTSNNLSLNATKPNKPPDVPTAPATVQSNQLMTVVTLPSNVPPPAKKVPSGRTTEDPKLLSKTTPSLCVVVRPANAVPDAVNAKKREALDSFVKSRLVLDGRRFAEWIMQVGLLRSQQFGLCRTHCNGNPTPVPLQLRMYAEENKFPYRLEKLWIVN